MLSDAYDLRQLTAQLGTPAFEQQTKRAGDACLLVHWGCGCTAIGRPAVQAADALLRWTRCAHHALAEAATA